MPNKATSALVAYFIVSVLVQFGLNANTTASMCGSANLGMSFLVTFIPWVIVFGFLNIALLMFPSWKSPFSNTVGYLVVWIAGVKDLLVDKIIKKNLESDFTPGEMRGGSKKRMFGGSSSENEMMIESIQHIYSDPSMLVNEVTPENYESFWKRMRPLFKRGADDYKEDLRKMIILKDIVAEAVWYMLGGGLITSISSNYIISKGCSRTVAEMKERHDQYEKDQEKIHAEKKDDKPRVYYTKE